MIIILTNTKGGVGKSTLTVHLCIWLFDRGHSVTLVDTDPQQTASSWLARVEKGIPVHSATEARKIKQLVQRLASSHEFVVCDTRGAYDSAETPTLANMADHAIIPLEPSDADIDELPKACFHLMCSRELRDGKPNISIILNKTSPKDAKSRVLRRRLMEKADIPVTHGTIRRLNAIRDVAKKGVVTRLRTVSGRDAARDFEAVFSEILFAALPRRKKVANG